MNVGVVVFTYADAAGELNVGSVGQILSILKLLLVWIDCTFDTASVDL